MGNISIIADSTCDLSGDLLERYHIKTFPLHIHLGEEEYLDGVNVSPEDLYRWSDANKATPKTSTVSPGEAQDVLNKALETGEEVICFCISEDMSACAQVMRLAAQELEVEDKVFIVNSASLSTGIGLQIIEAAVMAEQGVPAKVIVDRIKDLQPHVRASFVVDTLTYLHRGGRCSGLAAMAGSTFKLHPYIGVVDGKMKPGKKYRGKMEAVIRDYVKDLTPALKTAHKERVFITHSGCDQAILDGVKSQLKELDYFEEILTTRAGSVISSHCGPGTLGVLFIAGEDE